MVWKRAERQIAPHSHARTGGSFCSTVWHGGRVHIINSPSSLGLLIHPSNIAAGFFGDQYSSVAPLNRSLYSHWLGYSTLFGIDNSILIPHATTVVTLLPISNTFWLRLYGCLNHFQNISLHATFYRVCALIQSLHHVLHHRFTHE